MHGPIIINYHLIGSGAQHAKSYLKGGFHPFYSLQWNHAYRSQRTPDAAESSNYSVRTRSYFFKQNMMISISECILGLRRLLQLSQMTVVGVFSNAGVNTALCSADVHLLHKQGTPKIPHYESRSLASFTIDKITSLLDFSI